MEPESVTRGRFYTVNRVQEQIGNKLFEKGQVLKIGNSLNPGSLFPETVRRECYGIKREDGSDITPIDLIKAVNAGRIKAPGNFSDFICELISSLNKNVFELVFEEVRSESFSAVPSRRTCIWVLETIDEARQWEKMFKRYGPTKTVELLATGIIHRGDARWLKIDDDPLIEIREKAHNYWQAKLTTDPEPEILFEGTAEVVDILLAS